MPKRTPKAQALLDAHRATEVDRLNDMGPEKAVAFLRAHAQFIAPWQPGRAMMFETHADAIEAAPDA